MKSNDQWSSKFGFVLASAGSAIGLGALWKFPYMAGTNGGGAFFLVFLLFTFAVGAPMLLAEFVVGRHSQQNAVSSYESISGNPKWKWLGYLGVTASFIILSFYSVIGGWVITYLLRSFSGSLTGLPNSRYEQLFGEIIGSPSTSLITQAAFLAITIAIVQFGVQKGIETASRYMMPALFVLFLVLVARSLSLDGAMEGVAFFLQPDLTKLTAEGVLDALGQSFFALSVGISLMVTYSSYLDKNADLTGSVISVVSLNVFISFLAGLAIFPAVFAFGFEPSGGAGLIFTVLPAVFNQMAFGGLFFTIFMALLLFATLTSAFSLLEIIVSTVTRGKGNRKKVSWIAGFFVFLLGIPSALSFGVLADVSIFGRSIFDAMDFLASNLLMPVGALLISIFVSRKMKREILSSEVMMSSSIGRVIFPIWYGLIRYIVPAAILIVLITSLLAY
ncbi:sodium-dependent transporter [Bacillus sp. NTK071]|uniref:sodium-dependent transporter n=1 Tax=Bacillus sp. NTK071 TaxID=2802175 RepID=UPI001A8F54E4|nr:sodium-dependent transporter [Bacillus sp. NTK071]MBN8209356.1 sodium-dependent transporter [Bacillus sp. NTK071]